MFSRNYLQIFSLVASSICVSRTQAHGFLQTPSSRNYDAWLSGLGEYCPHCLNQGGVSNQCGSNGYNYDVPRTSTPKIQDTYVEGDTISVEVTITAHHKGHFEFAVCPVAFDEAPSFDCFQSSRLEFVADELYGAPKDENYPERAMMSPSNFAANIPSTAGAIGGIMYRFRMKLPDNVSGNFVLLQWRYITANSCTPIGYSNYPFPLDWDIKRNLSEEQELDPRELQCVGEEFWNCAEISISPSGPSAPATPNPSLQPVAAPPPATNAPVWQQPVQAPNDPVLGRYCGSSWFDASKCSMPCSDGNSTVCPAADRCYADVACSPTPTTVPVPAPTPAPVTKTSAPVPTVTAAPIAPQAPGTCGGGDPGNGRCPAPNMCCSKWGHCGRGDAWCNRRQLRMTNTTENEEIVAF